MWGSTDLQRYAPLAARLRVELDSGAALSKTEIAGRLRTDVVDVERAMTCYRRTGAGPTLVARRTRDGVLYVLTDDPELICRQDVFRMRQALGHARTQEAEDGRRVRDTDGRTREGRAARSVMKSSCRRREDLQEALEYELERLEELVGR